MKWKNQESLVKKQMVDIPKTKEEELDFEKEYEMEFFKKKTV